MTYATSNPPRKITEGDFDASQAGGTLWWYTSPTDSAATVAGTANYFSNGQDLGMRVGDLVFIYDVTNTIVKTCQVLSLQASPGRGVTLNATPVTVGGAS